MNEEVRKFWDLVKHNLNLEGWEKVADNYPELKVEAENLAQRFTRIRGQVEKLIVSLEK